VASDVFLLASCNDARERPEQAPSHQRARYENAIRALEEIDSAVTLRGVVCEFVDNAAEKEQGNPKKGPGLFF
jgi:hypothetical protein